MTITSITVEGVGTIRVGDRIKFKSATRSHCRKAWRIVNGFIYGRPTVRYHSCPEFMVRRKEITAMEQAGDDGGAAEESAMQQGMAHGIDAYNEAKGNGP